MYSHQVRELPDVVAIGHFREAPRPSGLVTVTELGHTFVPVARKERENTSSGLLLPSVADVYYAHMSRTNEDTPFIVCESIACNDLTEFVKSGRRKWLEIIRDRGLANRVDYYLATYDPPAETTLPNGLTIPNQSSEEFRGYVATPDEIEAITEIAALSVTTEPEPNTGMYL